MKVIFLDFDGVLNRFDDPRNLKELSSGCVKLLNQVIEQTHAYIVITSVWRILRTVGELRAKLVEAGFKYPQRVIGKSPRTGGRRGTEIYEWLKIRAQSRDDVESFIILDDDSDMEPFMDRLVQTDSDTGLTDLEVKKTVDMLR